jgi:hypothetical protein
VPVTSAARRAERIIAPRELRARRRGGVTDQGSRPEAPERIVASKEIADGNNEGESLHLRAFSGALVVIHPTARS